MDNILKVETEGSDLRGAGRNEIVWNLFIFNLNSITVGYSAMFGIFQTVWSITGRHRVQCSIVHRRSSTHDVQYKYIYSRGCQLGNFIFE